MTPREIERRADALFQGPESRRDLCTMVAYRESDNDELRAEVTALRELLHELGVEVEG